MYIIHIKCCCKNVKYGFPGARKTINMHLIEIIVPIYKNGISIAKFIFIYYRCLCTRELMQFILKSLENRSLVLNIIL